MKTLFKILGLLVLILFLTTCQKDNSDSFDKLDILEKIKTLEGVTATEITPPVGYSRAFQIDVTQPVDHNNPTGATFAQRVYLSFADESKPMILALNGYGARPTSVQEIAGILQANQLHVEHRYFQTSKPSPLDWKYLTVEQSAADHHNIVLLFKKIFKGKWISSGASKSGLTCLFHRRYYPDDVDATIAYVAPFIYGAKDERYPIYLRNIGGGDAFLKMMKVQQYVLKHRAEFLTLINNYIQTNGGTYTMDRELLLELDIMDYPFALWQYYSPTISPIPDTTTSTPTQIFNHYNSIVPISNFSDNTIAYYEPFTYQSITELGAPAYETGYLNGLIKKFDLNTSGNPNYELVAPKGITYTFNSTTIPEIYSWLQNHGDKIIYIYGKDDPWSAGAIELTGAADAVFVMQNGANHRVTIRSLDDPSIVYNALHNWLGIQITQTKAPSVSADERKDISFRLKE